MGNEIMMTENIISLESLRLKAQIFFESDKRKTSLRPCNTERYPEVSIECFRDLDGYKAGDTIEVDVVAMQSSNGRCYFYSY